MATLSDTALHIVAASATLSERLAGTFVPDNSDGAGGAGAARLERWCDHVAQGNQIRFDRRLAWDGLDREAARVLLGPVRLPDCAPRPVWARLIDLADQAMARPPSPGSTAIPSLLFDPTDPQPFEEVIQPFVLAAERRFFNTLGRRRSRLLDRSAIIDLERGLLRELCGVAARTLCAEFDAYRNAYGGGHLLGLAGTPTSGRRLYLDFVHSMVGDRFTTWTRRYPMLARLLAARSQCWVTTSAEMLRRLDRDADAIRTTFQIPDTTLRVVQVEPGLSDAHRGGRTVCRIRFASGARLIYKPRTVRLERHFSTLLERLGNADARFRLRTPAVLPRGQYGWMEAVTAVSCTDAAAVERFYWRAGVLTGLAYGLGGRDLHADNLIAAGEHPVLIDLECLATAPVCDAQDAETLPSPACVRSHGSVLQTGLVPMACRGGNGPSDLFRVTGGLTASEPIAGRRHDIAYLNTDWARWRRFAPRATHSRNLPMLQGHPQRASTHLGAILDGFRAACIALTRMPLGARPITSLDRTPFRIVIRDTSIYASLLAHALAPQHLVSGADWSIALDLVTAPELAVADRPTYWSTRAAERADLEQLDIPLFTASRDQPELRASSGVLVDNRIDCTGTRVSERIRSLTPANVDRQLRLLRLSFDAIEVKKRHRPRRARVHTTQRPDPQLTADQAATEVTAIIDLLRDTAVNDGRAIGWYELDPMPGRSPDIRPVGSSLFAGIAGIGLFLAMAYLVTGARDARDLALRLFEPISRRLTGRRRLAFTADIGIGGGRGLGGLIHALARAGAALGSSACLRAARDAATVLTREAIDEDETLDVMGGSAGALFGLLTLHRLTNDPMALQRATRCGEHLLATRTRDPATGLCTWHPGSNRDRIGFAHGAAGIACALHRLGTVTGNGVYREVAAEAWTVERRHVSGGRSCEDAPPASNGQPRGAGWTRTWTWCHGWPGIGLSRLGALDDHWPRVDLDVALTATTHTLTRESWKGRGGDSLCCGRFGQAEFLLSAGRSLNRPALCDAARAIGGRTVAQALATGSYRIGGDDMLRPGLYQGLAGVGYELLRLQAADTVPSVLLWE